MPQLIDVPGMGAVEFPDGMSDEQIASAIQNNISPQPKEKINPFWATVDAFNAGADRFVHGVMQPIYEGLLGNTRVGDVSKQWAKDREANYANVEQQYPTLAPIASIAGGIAATSPLMAIPGFGKSAAVKAITQGMAQGAAAGGGQYVEGNNLNDRLENALIGTAIGGTVPAALQGLSSAARGIRSLSNRVPNNMLQGVDEVKTTKTKAAADRLGLNITPAEASGSPIAAKAQGALGTSEKGAQQMVDFGEQRFGAEKGIISDLLNDVSPNKTTAAPGVRDIAREIQDAKETAFISPEKAKIDDLLTGLGAADDVSNQVRQAAKDIIGGEEQKLIKKANPRYEAAYKKKVAPNKIKSLMASDGTIEDAINGVLNDPKYRFELQDYAPNSIRVLDLAKRRIDAKINAAKGSVMQPGDKDAVRVLTDSKNRLLSSIDGFSKDYAQARKIYSEGAKPLTQLRESNLGRLADLDDTQLKNVSKVVFDPSQTNLNVIADLRNKIGKKNPSIWKNLIRNELDRRLNKAGSEVTGDIFFKKALGNQQDFKMFMEATKGFPAIQKQLINMRTQFSTSAEQLKQLRNTDIARLANLKDPQLKNISSTIFDPAQTDLNVLRNYRDLISSKSPDTWKQLVRNELERRIDGSGNYAATNFYDAVLKSDRSFKQFLVATKGMPEVRQKLVDMKRSFRDLIEPVTAKTAARLAKSSLDVPRSTYEAISNFVSNMLGGKYDQAAIKFITSNNWDKQFSAINKISNRTQRASKLAELLENIASRGTAVAATQPDTQDDS
jgi:hypothetical protein